jgi:hypothetical protein
MRYRPLLLATALLALGSAAARAQLTDQHYVSADSEYFVADQDYNGGWQWVVLARMLRPASDTTHGEAQFISLGGNKTAGERFWSRYFWKTRVAKPDDLKVAKVVFCADLGEGEIYRAPRSRQETLENRWWMATITDVSDLYKQEVRVGEYRVNVNAMRVVVH